jgi:hypothetical protein
LCSGPTRSGFHLRTSSPDARSQTRHSFRSSN